MFVSRVTHTSRLKLLHSEWLSLAFLVACQAHSKFVLSSCASRVRNLFGTCSRGALLLAPLDTNVSDERIMPSLFLASARAPCIFIVYCKGLLYIQIGPPHDM